MSSPEKSNGDTSPNNNKSEYLPTLDGWRAIAIVLVLIYHSNNGEKKAWWQDYSIGHLGVGIFFSLSGFLICSKILSDFDRSKFWNLKNFYIRRFFRIIPAAWVFILTLLITGFIWNIANLKEILSSVFFLRNYVSGGAGYYTSHFWSLAVEEHFYLLFPPTLALLGIRRSIWIFPVISLTSALLRNFGLQIAEQSGIYLPPGTFFWSKSHVRMDSLLWGCWWALIIKQFPQFCSKIKFLPLLFISSLVIVFSLTLASPVSLHSFFLPIIILATVLNPKWRFSEFLELRPIKWFGKLSYSIYLWQQLFFVQKPELFIDAIQPLQYFPSNLFAVITLASLSYYLIELPFIRLGRKLTYKI